MKTAQIFFSLTGLTTVKFLRNNFLTRNMQDLYSVITFEGIQDFTKCYNVRLTDAMPAGGIHFGPPLLIFLGAKLGVNE